MEVTIAANNGNVCVQSPSTPGSWCKKIRQMRRVTVQRVYSMLVKAGGRGWSIIKIERKQKFAVRQRVKDEWDPE